MLTTAVLMLRDLGKTWGRSLQCLKGNAYSLSNTGIDLLKYTKRDLGPNNMEFHHLLTALVMNLC